MSNSNIHGKLLEFYRQHPECQDMIDHCRFDWTGLFGENYTADIAEAGQEAKAQYKYYTKKGYILRDEKMIEDSNGESYRICCYMRKTPKEDTKFNFTIDDIMPFLYEIIVGLVILYCIIFEVEW